MGSYDLRIVKKDHSDHTDVKNFASFYDFHIEFLAMVERGDLSPPSALVQAVGALSKALNEKFTQKNGSL
jgi:hypothetical protein